MSDDEEYRFRPRPGRIRSDAPQAGKAKSFLTRAKALARQHSNSPPRSASGAAGKGGGSVGASGGRASGGGAVGGAGSGAARGPGVQRGRGAAFARSRTLSGGWRHSQPGARHVVVKTRYVRQAGKSGKAASHLRYIQRDGTSRDGERGQLYSAGEDRADGDAFLARGQDDERQFRFIISPEDGAELSDLTAYTRDVMAQVERDLGTKLDWVAVNHHNTGHPHVHVVVRGVDDLGQNLVINGDYLANGIRERASELASLELGPVSEIEQRRKLAMEVDQDRFTRLDRAMVGEAEGQMLDLRREPAHPGLGQGGDQHDRTLRLRRLAKLEDMGLASEHAPGVWELSPRMEATLRELGVRGDIIKAMHKALEAEGVERDPASFVIHDAAPRAPIVGRVIGKHLTDEMGENLTLVIDGIDGRTHHISGFDAERVADAHIGGVVEIGPAETSARPSDKAIAAMAKNGLYYPSRHLEQARFDGRVPGGDYQGFIDAHVRRLEALRRAGIVERIDADQWRIPQDFAERAAAHDAARGPRANVRVLSALDLERQIASDGATWLDRRLIKPGVSDLAGSGFGEDVARAMERRRQALIDRGDATARPDGGTAYRRNLIAALQEREVARVGEEMAGKKGVPFRAAGDSETVSGKFTGTMQLSSGKFAILEKSHEFTLVPWRPVIDRQLGRQVMGVMQRGSIDWQLGKQRGLGL